MGLATPNTCMVCAGLMVMGGKVCTPRLRVKGGAAFPDVWRWQVL
jgi:hypothetical protein